MNSKHRYISFARGNGRWEYLPVIGGREEEKLGGPRAVNHIAPRLRDLSHRRVGTFKIFASAKKRTLGVIQRRRVDARTY